MESRVTILIVDDLPENLVALESLLDDPELEIVSARSGNEALQRMLEINPALVLLDVQMPGMDGYETAELMRLNPRTRGTPIIFVTANSSEQRHVFRGYEAGAVDYLPKPIEPVILRSKVQIFCQLWRQRDQLAASRRELAAANRVLAQRNEDFERELDLARKVQLGFLPSAYPAPDRIHFAHSYQICTTLGGDLFDVFALDSDRVGLYIADVSGHGVNAALISSLLKMAMENFKARAAADPAAAALLADPAALLANLAHVLANLIPDDTFITMNYTVVDLPSRRALMAGAGHPYPVYCDRGRNVASFEEIQNGPALGFGLDLPYANLARQLAPGDALLFYTDGITEAMDADMAEFGDDALLQSVRRHHAGPLETLIAGILADVERHRSGEIINDDCAILALQV
jgi:phosphoserine phosphatase RsbU/P